jgi:hypothetical protein
MALAADAIMPAIHQVAPQPSKTIKTAFCSFFRMKLSPRPWRRNGRDTISPQRWAVQK